MSFMLVWKLHFYSFILALFIHTTQHIRCLKRRSTAGFVLVKQTFRTESLLNGWTPVTNKLHS